MEKLYLRDLLHFSEEEYGNVKIRFNQSNGYDDPMTYISIIQISLIISGYFGEVNNVIFK